MAAEAVDLESLLERLHDRCVARNLRAAGLGGINTVEEEKIYGRLDPNMRMANGDPVLHATIDFCANPQLQARYVAMLLAEGADVNGKDNGGQTALMRVCRHGCERTAKQILRQKELNLSAKDANGNTALHLVSAAKYGQDKIVRQILKCQRKRSRREPTADLLEVLNDLGETAADVALRSGNFFVSHSLEAEKQQRADSPGHRYLHTSLDAITSARSDEEGLVEPIRRLKFTSSPNLAGVNQRYSPADHSNGFDLLADISVTVDLRAEPSRVSRTKSVGPTTAAPPLAKPNLADRIRKFIRRKSHGELHKPESNSELSGSAHKYRSDDQPTNSSPEVPSSTRVSRQSPPAATSVDNLAKFRLLLRRQHDLEPTALKRSETSVWPPTLQPAAPDDRQTPPPITLRRNQTGKRGKNNQQPLRALPPLRGFQPIQK